MHHNCIFLFICETCSYYQQLFKSLFFSHFTKMTLNFKNIYQSYTAAHVVCIVNNIFATTTIQHNDHSVMSLDYELLFSYSVFSTLQRQFSRLKLC